METTGEPLHFVGAGEWRAWLQENHAVANDAWLMISKKHAKEPSLSLAEATEEALCFGWIDSAMHPIDDERYALRYTPRRKGSNWSERNKALTARLSDEGRMTDAGLAAIEEAKRNGRWDTVRRQPAPEEGVRMTDDRLLEMGPVIPMLSYEDVARAADWVAEAFGFVETGRWSDPDGRVTHVNMGSGAGTIMLGFPSPDYQSPRHHAEVCEHARAWSTTTFVVDGVLVYVDDVDTHFERARASGATILSSLEDNREIGQRQYRAEDLEGHRWMFAQPI